MASGFWKKLLANTFDELKAQELDETEAEKLRKKGYVRRHYYFSGKVQEVGFRYTAFYIAEKLELTGWVSNLSDGRVEMEVQGCMETIDRMLCKLDESGRIRIDRIEEEERCLLKEDGFKVRGY